MTTNTEPRTAVKQLRGRLSQCTACGEVFGGISDFDEHRVWNGQHRVCKDPADMGLVILSNANGTRWGQPMSADASAQIAAA